MWQYPYTYFILFIDMIVVVVWLIILVRLDENRKIKKSSTVIMQFYFFGLLSTVLVAVLYFISDYAWIILYTGNYYIDIFILDFLFVGPFEEFSKFAIFYVFARYKRSIHEPRDGILQAASVALAFASVENFIYGINYGVGTLLFRSLLTISGHMTYTVIWSFFYSVFLFSNDGKLGWNLGRLVLAALLPASFIHGLYNFFLDLGEFWLALFLDITVLAAAIGAYRYLKQNSPFGRQALSQYKKAIPFLKKALKQFPRSPRLHYRLALYYLYGQMPEKALEHLKRCMRLGAHTSLTVFLSGIAHYTAGNRRDGQETIRNAYSLQNEEKKRKVRNMVKTLVKKRHVREEIMDILRETDRVHGRKYKTTRIRTPGRVVNRAGIPYRNILEEKTEELRREMQKRKTTSVPRSIEN
jgi:RsiW-degrading membrane proteinase PrsW (M82 family)